MHRFGAWLTALLLFALTGCFTSTAARPSTWVERVRNANRTLPPDGVVLEIHIIEQPLADPFINRELWTFTDDQKGMPEDNGFRVGHVVGNLPGRLPDLLTSDRCCAMRWRQLLASNDKKRIPLGPTLERRQYTLRKDGQATPVTLDRAQPFLVLTPTVTADGRTTLRFTPEVQHGETVPNIQPAPGLTGWELEYHPRQESYADLAWEVTLAPNDYVVVGAFIDDTESLGAQCFSQEDERARVQRLLVIRTTRGLPGVNEMLPLDSQDSTPPLALQASWSGGSGR